MEMSVQNNRLEIKEGSAQVAAGALRWAVSIEELKAAAKGTASFTAEKLLMEKLLPPRGGGQPQLKGRLSGTFQGFFQGRKKFWL